MVNALRSRHYACKRGIHGDEWTRVQLSPWPAFVDAAMRACCTRNVTLFKVVSTAEKVGKVLTVGWQGSGNGGRGSLHRSIVPGNTFLVREETRN